MQKEQSPHQRRSQLKPNPVAPSIKYKGIYTIVVKIYGNFDVDISIFFSFTVVRAHEPGMKSQRGFAPAPHSGFSPLFCTRRSRRFLSDSIPQQQCMVVLLVYTLLAT